MRHTEYAIRGHRSPNVQRATGHHVVMWIVSDKDENIIRSEGGDGKTDLA